MYQYSLYVFICIYLYLNCWGKVLKDLYLYVHINLIKMQQKKKKNILCHCGASTHFIAEIPNRKFTAELANRSGQPGQ